MLQDAIAPPTGRTSAALFVSLSVALGTAVAILTHWLQPGRAWIEPELLPLAGKIWDRTDLLSRLAIIFDWRIFEPNPHRLRPVSDSFEIIDAIARPFISHIIVHPVLSITTCTFVILVMTFAYRLFRLNQLTRAESLLFCSLLAAMPGFLSNLFVYIRPAKPLSFVLIAALLLCLFHYAADLSRRRLAVIYVLLVIGGFTDELMIWAYFFVAVALLLLGAYKKAGSISLVLVAAGLTSAVILFVVLPVVYEYLGPGGMRTVNLTDPESGESVARRMLSYWTRKELYKRGVVVSARTIAASFGLYENSTLNIVFGLLVIGSALAGLTIFFHKRQTPAWRLGAVGLFGLLSFSQFGAWLHWFHGPRTLEDHVAVNYYYNSPVAIFVVLLGASGFKAVHDFIAGDSSTRAAHSVVAAAVVIAGLIGHNIVSFMGLNEVQRMYHLGPTDTDAIYRQMNLPHIGDAPPMVMVTGEPERLERMLTNYNQLGSTLFGEGWVNSGFYRDRRWFETKMQWIGPGYAVFGQRYGFGLCSIHFPHQACPVEFRQTP